MGFDFETGRDRKTIDDHLGDFGKRLKAKWHSRFCFVDTKYIGPPTRMDDGRHFIETIFEDARDKGCRAIPVVGLFNDRQSLTATASVIRADQRGVALRLTLDDFEVKNLATDIRKILNILGVAYADTDLIVDEGALSFQQTRTFVRMMLTLLKMIPVLDRWRTFTIVGTNYPPTIGGLRTPFDVFPRQEWITYQALVNRLGSRSRKPAFGDYAVTHPDPVELDMRIVKPYAKLRYTIDDSWHIGRGATVRELGFPQYRRLCRNLMAQPYFDGPGYSAGDDYIADCAAGTVSTGNFSTWVWVSTNRHLTKVVNDLATFHGLSDIAE
ncbi:MAG: beta family protein [Desulfobacterales bacterium]|nr:beta family protein [Desulfobacterales bacterium]